MVFLCNVFPITGKSDEDDKEPGLMSNRPEGPTGSEGRTKAAVLRCSCSLGYSGEFCDVNSKSCRIKHGGVTRCLGKEKGKKDRQK